MNLLYRINYLFRPKGLLLVCLIAAVGVDVAYILVCHYSILDLYRDIFFAVATGVTASALLIILTEMTNNYKANWKKWFLLSDLFWFLARYEMEVQREMMAYDYDLKFFDLEREEHQKAVRGKKETKKEAAEAMAESEKHLTEAREMKEKYNEWELKKSRVGAVYDMLPDIIDLIEDNYDKHKDLLTIEELELFDCILSAYKGILFEITRLIKSRTNTQFGDSFNSEILSLMDAPTRMMTAALPDDAILNLAMESWNCQLEVVAKEIIKGGTQMLNAMEVSLEEDPCSLREEKDSFEFSNFPNDSEEIDFEKLTKHTEHIESEGEGDDLCFNFIGESIEEINKKAAKNIVFYVHFIDGTIIDMAKLLIREPGYGRILKREEEDIKKYGVSSK